ncbi:phage portal protein, putative, A118 family [Haloechinothrix alba]|uniref:Phage portal protein, putative, A118 family n=1 Tax=Haloechinothrix alba TaxID=664784 RepID=A0A238WCU5_9PSEU|nr:hypothetical protein [Haloechinothrix alba]SNR44237.1 phage portal protein, putative, A118 family [Haloechinothrix alba]
MPLPEPGTPWPPPQWASIYSAYSQWDAWYSGDVDKLSTVYGATSGWAPDPKGYNKPSQYSDGMVGRLSRWFWGTPQRQIRSNKLHVPAAADIASTSADLLFSEPPSVKVGTRDTATQQRLDDLFGPEMIVALLDGAEVAAALSGVFLRAGWVGRQPVPSVVHPDAAIPVFKWGTLAEVTFHRVVQEYDGNVMRHLEHHVPGGVQHALYLGDKDRLGRTVPLTEHEDTAQLAAGLAEDGQTIPTGIDDLTVVYVPNATPNRQWRTHQQAAHLGRSDLSGIEPVMDALDETYTSWMRDIRLAKARIAVPESYLETGGRGAGAWFDADREVFTGLNMLPGQDSSPISAHQFAIRHEEHRQTCSELWEKAVRGAGYSAQTFGLTSEVAMTATESNARERKTLLTRGKKARLWRMALGKLAELLLRVDRAQFNASVTPQRPDVEFPAAVSEQPRERAETARLLTEAEAVSTDTKVRMVHPDWDDERVKQEVEGIMSDRPEGPEMRV